MALVLADRVRETTTTAGTGTITLAGAVTGYQSFSAIGNGNTTYYTIAGQNTSEWEVGIGTYTSSGTTLSRTTVLASSNAGSLVPFSAGTKDVFVTYPAEKSINQDASGNTTIPNTLTATTLNLTNALGTSYGGTGLTSFTANGVVYASSTSALATSSALTFDGAGNFFNSASGGGFWLSAAGTYVMGMYQNGTSLTFRTNTTGQYTIDSSGNSIWSPGGTEGMRLTSTGLGIGTSSPQAKLVVQQANNAGDGIRLYASGTDSQLITRYLSSSDIWQITASYASSGAYKPIAWFTSDVERMRLDSSGNLGLGVTPSAWNTNKRALQIGARAALWSDSDITTDLTNNVYVSATASTYLQTAAATRYLQQLGTHIWYNAPSGTAGTTITFTQAMTLDASGNLGIGTTSPAYKLDVAGDIALKNNATYLYGKTSGGTTTRMLGINAVNDLYIGSIDASINNIIFLGSSRRVTIDSSGNVGIGTSSPTQKLDVAGNGNFSGTITLGSALAVSSGGTGLTSATAYAVLTGGTTSTGAHQSVSGTGTTGQVLTSNGAGALPTWQTASGGSSYTSITSNTTATAGTNYLCDTSSGSFTLTLPASPSTGSVIGILDAKGTFAIYPLAVAPNGKTIMTDSGNMYAANTGYSAFLVYNGSDWRVA